MDVNAEDLYTSVILENSRNKDFKKPMPGAIEKRGHNANCGDDLTIYIVLKEMETNREYNIIEDISFDGTGCAISEATANIMCSMLKGKKVKEAKKIIQIYLDMLLMKEEDKDRQMMQEQLKDAYAFANIAYMPYRIKCATLAWNSALEIIDNYLQRKG